MKFKKKGVYTIATIYNIEGARGGIKTYFEYYVYGKRYTSSGVVSKNKEKETIGKRYFVQYLASQPNRCYMEGIPVPDSITEAPIGGWTEIPIGN